MIEQLETLSPRSGPGRPPIGPSVVVRVREDYKCEVEEEAKELGCPAAEIWRDIIDRGYWARRGSA